MPRRSAAARAARLHPARVVVLAFCTLIAVGAVLLLLPIAHAPGRSTTVVDAIFTATSAVCVTGLTVLDTETHWSPFGKVVIMLLIQVGGFGVMSLGSLVALLLSRRIGMRLTMRTRAERSVDFGDVKRLLLVLAGTTLVVEAVTAVALAVEFMRGYEMSPGRAFAHGVFHAVSSFNNAGFALNSDNMVGFVHNWWISGVISLSIIVGGLGFPVLLDLWQRRRRPRGWGLHTKITVLTTAALLVFAFCVIIGFEWSNDGTIGEFAWHEKLLASGFHAVQPRTAGFNTVDVGAMNEPTLFVTDGLMLVGGGSASTAGGIKVTTFALLAFVIWAEVRGRGDVDAFDRRIPTELQRQAVSVALIAVGVVVVGTSVLLQSSGLELSEGLFESLSAFGTVGLSTGITATLDATSKWVLIILMVIGRVGPVTFGAALVLAGSRRRYRLPSEGMLVG